jgi:hypothetical protein
VVVQVKVLRIEALFAFLSRARYPQRAVAIVECISCPVCGTYTPSKRLGIVSGEYDPEEHVQIPLSIQTRYIGGRGRLRVEANALPQDQAEALRETLRVSLQRLEQQMGDVGMEVGETEEEDVEEEDFSYPP